MTNANLTGEDRALCLLRQAIDAGATFSDFIRLTAAKNSARDEAIIELARHQFHRDGEIEIDDRTICSGTGEDEHGDYVLAWLWVDFEASGAGRG